MNRSIVKAFTLGLSLLILAHIGWATLMSQNIPNQFLDWLLRLLPIAAAFAAATLATKNKVLVGMSMVLAGTVLTLATNYLLQLREVSVDFPGLRGAIALLPPTVLTYVVLCGVGTAAGIWVSKKRARGAIP